MISPQDERDFEEFVRDCSTPLLRTAYLLVGDRGHAEDLVQTALLRTARRWRQAQGNPRSYARQVVVNLAKDRWRNLGRRPAETPVADFTDQARLAVAPDHSSELLAATRSLPRGQRAVLVLRFFDGLSVEETAAALGCSAGTVKSQCHKGLARLRAVLDEGAVTTGTSSF